MSDPNNAQTLPGMPSIKDGMDTPISASRTYLDFNLASHHFCNKTEDSCRVWNGNTSKPFNQHNFGVGVTHMKEVWRSENGDYSASQGFSLGQYHNSLYRQTIYATANGELNYQLTPTLRAGMGAQVGAVTGYGNSILPAAHIYTRLEKELGGEIAGIRSVFIQLGVIPAARNATNSTPATATARVGVRF